MGKKSRRRRSTPRLSAAQLVQPGEQAVPSVTPAVVQTPHAPKTSARALRDLREEYPYVAADLKRIAIIAVVMLALMVGLALLLV